LVFPEPIEDIGIPDGFSGWRAWNSGRILKMRPEIPDVFLKMPKIRDGNWALGVKNSGSSVPGPINDIGM
jgi:hypothetical protein